jgi:hypothetical protein
MFQLVLIIFVGFFSCLSARHEWMDAQIEQELQAFKKYPFISKKKMDAVVYDKNNEHLYLVKFTIKNNKVFTSKSFKKEFPRELLIKKILTKLGKKRPLPDLDFITTMHDELDQEFDVPILVMAKNDHHFKQILIPDFEALEGKYQVFKNKDVTSFFVPWNSKINQLIWRGSTAQYSLNGLHECMNCDNLKLFSRVFLCELSKSYPHLIDAKFTSFVQGAENVPYVQQFKGNFVSFKHQFKYKYHLMVDGNSAPYSASGWKLFTNSLLFKADSDKIQWYYRLLKPYEHYIPVKEDLSDLFEQLTYYKNHSLEAQSIATNARNFAITHICQNDNLAYLYKTLIQYSKLNFIDD